MYSTMHSNSKSFHISTIPGTKSQCSSSYKLSNKLGCHIIVPTLTIVNHNYQSIFDTAIEMPIGSVQANLAQLSVESTDTFQQVDREAAEVKLY